MVCVWGGGFLSLYKKCIGEEEFSFRVVQLLEYRHLSIFFVCCWKKLFRSSGGTTEGHPPPSQKWNCAMIKFDIIIIIWLYITTLIIFLSKYYYILYTTIHTVTGFFPTLRAAAAAAARASLRRNGFLPFLFPDYLRRPPAWGAWHFFI